MSRDPIEDGCYGDESIARDQEFGYMLELMNSEEAAALEALRPDPDVSSEAMVVRFPKAA